MCVVVCVIVRARVCACVCKLCDCAGVEKYHLLWFVSVNCGQQIHVNRTNIGRSYNAACL